MRRPSVPFLITAFVIVMIFVGLLFIRWPDFAHINDVGRIANQTAAVYLRLTVRYANPPVYEERWAMQDVNGVSSAEYKVTGFSGKVITIAVPPTRTTDVSFFSERVVADGIWQLTNKPARGDTSRTYTVWIRQLADNREGTRTVIFTDPHYWATAAGRQYAIHLDPKKPTPDLLKLQSSSIADTRYQKIVDEFTTFGTPSFREKVVRARAAVVSSR